jgi:hypothetical protein
MYNLFVYLLGRPLTKKSGASAVLCMDDDDGYGTCSPTIASPQLNNNIFNFVEPVGPNTSLISMVSEDEWSSLEKELNQILNIQPLAESRVKISGVCNQRTTQISIYPTTFANKQPRVSCQFCAKNGEIRSVVWTNFMNTYL